VGEWPRNARCGRVHGEVRGREVREGEEADRWGPLASEGEHVNRRSALTERTHRAERGSERTREGTDADNPAPPGSRRERGGERGRGPSLIGGTHLSGEAGAHAAWLGWIGPAGLRWVFLFPGNFETLFFLFSLWISSQIQTKFKFKQFQTCASNERIIWLRMMQHFMTHIGFDIINK
jgi:hypothetical protein